MDDETGEILNEELLDELMIAEEEKIENIALWIKNLRADAAALKEEKKAFDKRIKSAESKEKSLTKYLQSYLQNKPFESNKVKISYRKSQSVEIAVGTVLPAEYLKVSYEPKKDEIKKAIKEGKVIEGCSIIDNNNIQIG